MTAFAYFGEYQSRIDLYISARASGYTSDWQYAELKLSGDYLIVYPKENKEPGTVKCRRVDANRKCDARTMCCGKLFTEGMLSRSLIGKRLKLKKMKTDDGYALVVCLKEEV